MMGKSSAVMFGLSCEPSKYGTTGTPDLSASARAASFLPMSSITEALGPINTNPASVTAWAKNAR
jgi:hypothetical protein